MTNSKRIYFGVVAALMLASGAQADSNKINWISNGHFYQRFERNFTWEESKAYCEGLSAHLVTITSAEEQTFIDNSLLSQSISYSFNYYHIGGSDAAQEGTWKWVTGEPWVYGNWDSGQPSNGSGENYLIINDYYGDWSDSAASGSNIKGFICEWSYNTFIGASAVPDLNGNDVAEVAALYVNYKTSQHTVAIKDGQSGALLSTLTFATDDHPPIGVVTLKDINDNGVPEIAVLYTDTTIGDSKVAIKDAKNNAATLRKYSVLGLSYTPKNITASPDLNDIGSSKFTVIGVEGATGKAQARIIDSLTGKSVGKAVY